MNAEEILFELLNRVGAQQGSAIHVNERELGEWPSDAVAMMKTQGLITKAQPAKSAICPGCERECVMPVHVITDKNPIPAAFIVCDKRSDINRVPVTINNLEQWQVSGETIASLLAKLLGINRPHNFSTHSSRWEVGLIKGAKHSSHLILTTDGKLNLSLAGHALPLAEVLTIDKCKFFIDRKFLNRLVDKPVAGAGDKESAIQRRERLIKRVEELKLKGDRSFLKTVAEEEGISVSRLKQIIAKKESVKPKNW